MRKYDLLYVYAQFAIMLIGFLFLSKQEFVGFCKWYIPLNLGTLLVIYIATGLITWHKLNNVYGNRSVYMYRKFQFILNLVLSVVLVTGWYMVEYSTLTIFGLFSMVVGSFLILNTIIENIQVNCLIYEHYEM